MRICSNCGFENGDDFKFCRECGRPFETDINNEQDIVGNDNNTDKEVLADEKVGADKLQARSDTKVFNIDEVYAKESDDKEEINFNDDDDEYDDDDVTDEPARVDNFGKNVQENRKRSMKRNSVAGDIIFIVVTLLLIVLIVLLSLLYIKGNYPGDTLKAKIDYMISSTFSNSIITSAPTITASETQEGDPAIVITVYAKRGCIVTFQEGATRMERTVEGQSIAFRVPTSLWTANAAEADAIEGVLIEPNVFVYDPSRSNEVIKLEFEPYRVNVHTVDITLTSPETLNFATSNSTVEIEGSVSDADVAVFMNGNQLQLDEQGYFKTMYHVESLGEQKVVFTAQKGSVIVGTTVLKVNYTMSDIDIEIYNTEMRTFTDTLLVSGRVEVGAGLKVSGVDLDGELNLDESTGEFNFTAKLPAVGNYIITLGLSRDDTSASVDIYAEHAPDKDDYIRSALDFDDYEWVKEHPTMSQHYGITGTITEVYQTEPYVKAKLHTSEGDIIFTYYFTTAVETNDGKTYRIYAYLDGTDQETGLPQLYCWFIHKS